MNKKWKKILSIFLATVILTPVCAVIPGGVSSAEDSSLSELKVNSTDYPVGIDTTPVFSWVISAEGRGRGQTAYRVIVSSSEELAEAGTGDLWDSGKTPGEDNYDVIYEGAELASKTTYYWTAESWDENDRSLGKSAVASFTTGIFEDDEWQGDWIGIAKKTYDLTLAGANWIWLGGSGGFTGSAQGTQYARKSFEIDSSKTVSEVLVGYTADDQSVLYFNGTEQGDTSAWSSGGLFDATQSVVAGKNTVAISGYNSSAGYAGICAKILVKYSDGSSDTYNSDNSWKMSDTEADGWYTGEFNDSSWSAPTQNVSFGSSPWGSGVSLEVAGGRAAVTLRKDFNVAKEIDSAVAYVSGLGYFDFTINGKNADDTLLNPCNTQYDQTVLYRAFDVTSMVKQGGNALGVELGNGFYNEIGGVWSWGTAVWRDNPKLLLNLEIKYADGTSETIVTDTSWSITNQGPTTTNGIYYGETYDARKELGEFDTHGYDASAWSQAAVVAAPTGELVCQINDPMRRTQTFAPKNITKLSNGSYVITCPEMVAGWAKLSGINQAAGQKITITYSEKLNSDGTVQKLGGTDGVNSNWWPHAYIMQDNYITKGTANEEFEPKFSYKGFEYIQIDGFEGDLAAENIEIYRTANDVEISSEIETSSEMVNSLHKIMRTTMLNNFQGKPTDTPVWEKNGWLGDANVAIQTMMYNFDMSNYLPNFVEIMEDCFDFYGTVPNMVPTANWGVDNSAVWNTIFVLGVAELQNYYGLSSYSSEQYDVMRRFALKDITEIRNNGWVWHDGQLSDWVSPIGGSDPDVQYTESQSEGSGICGTGFVYLMLEEMAEFADQLGKTADATEYRAAMANIKTAFNNKFYNASKGIYETTTWNQIGTRTRYRQTSNLVPLALGLIPDEYVDTVMKNLINDIVEKEYHLDTGVVGTKYLLPVLSDYGYSDVAYKILTQKTYPSWGFWLEQGSTSTWEMWEGTSRSLDHYFLGTYDEWIYSHLAGVTDIKNGYKTFSVRPYITGGITSVSADIKTVRGNISVDINIDAQENATYDITVPFGSTANIYMPTAYRTSVQLDGKRISTAIDGVESVSMVDGQICVTVGSGTYSFVSPTDLVTVYKDELSDAIDYAESIETTGIGTDVERLVSAIAAAKSVLADNSATQIAVNAALSDLEAAVSEFLPSDTRKVVTAYVAECAESIPESAAALYSSDEFLKYLSALTAADIMSKDYSVSDNRLSAALTALQTAFDAVKAAKHQNYALGIKATASSSNESSYWGWGIEYMTDGDNKNINRENDYTGYCSNLDTNSNHSEWVSLDLGEVKTINNVTVYSACANVGGEMIGYGFPEDFEIQVSTDGNSWSTVYSATDYPIPGYGPQSFTFDSAVDAQYVKFVGNSLRPKETDNNSYRMQFSELEIYNTSSGEPSAITYIDVNGVELDPAFDIDTNEYTADVDFDKSLVVITPYTTQGLAVNINGTPLGSEKSRTIELETGENVITVSAGGKDYVIKITRAESSVLRGDLDGNGTINVSDVVALRQAIMNNSANDYQKAAGDMDDNGSLNVSDVVALRQLIMNTPAS